MLVPCTTYKSKWSKLLKLWIFGQPVVEVLILLVVVVFCCDSAGTTTVQFCTLTPVQRVTRRGRYLAYSTSRPASPRSVWWLIQQPTCCHVVVSRYWAIWLHAWFQSLDLLLYHSRTCGWNAVTVVSISVSIIMCKPNCAITVQYSVSAFIVKALRLASSSCFHNGNTVCICEIQTVAKNTEFLVNCCTPAFLKLEVHQNSFPSGTLPGPCWKTHSPSFPSWLIN